MTLKPLQYLCAIAFALLVLPLNAQQKFQGKAYYQTKTSMDLESWGNREISPDQKKRIQERMKGLLEKVYILNFNKEASMYKEDEKLEAMNSGGSFRGFGASFVAGPKYKNVKTKQQIQQQEFFGKQFLITDSLANLQWQLGSETKQIGNYTCYKATATKPVSKADWRSMRPRRRQSSKPADSIKTKTAEIPEVDTPKTIEVTAWYTLQIPINQGPDDYWGLPGLILEVNADKTTILCTKIIMNPEEKETIEAPKKGEKVTQQEYTDIITKKMKEMRDMYRGRGRGGRGRN